ncbi:hypothetical protein BC830DRAFT_1119099 [Chytriomyces sp. MP71]|nr:hypothetical protein BC830DRAFT_1119099 [Chytriomyces sp. MP71]
MAHVLLLLVLWWMHRWIPRGGNMLRRRRCEGPLLLRHGVNIVSMIWDPHTRTIFPSRDRMKIVATHEGGRDTV